MRSNQRWMLVACDNGHLLHGHFSALRPWRAVYRKLPWTTARKRSRWSEPPCSPGLGWRRHTGSGLRRDRQTLRYCRRSQSPAQRLRRRHSDCWLLTSREQSKKDKRDGPVGDRVANQRLAHVQGLLGGMLLPDLTEDRVRGYIKARLGESAGGRTINMELGELSRALGHKGSALWQRVRKLEENHDIGRTSLPKRKGAYSLRRPATSHRRNRIVALAEYCAR